MRYLVVFLVCTICFPRLSVFAADEAQALSLVPKPHALAASREDVGFLLTEGAVISTDAEARPIAEILARELRDATGYRIHVSDTSTASAGRHGKIRLSVDASLARLGDEGYRLRSGGGGVEIAAAGYAGVFNGTRTLLQLFPAKIFSTRVADGVAWVIPAVEIEDSPRYAWRGMLLDVARYFLGKDFVLRYIDIMAAHKLNVLHLHLVDDAGWRLEIKKYPRLTEIGAFRGEGAARHGGFYTQDEMREIVAYAAARNITVVPEIELPAHVLSAIAAYPELGCTRERHKVPATFFIAKDLYCAGRDGTLQFLYDVFDEVCALFPSKYIHIGGDELKHASYARWRECPDCQQRIRELGLKDERGLHAWLNARVEEYLKTKKRIALGWEEIAGMGASPQAAVMAWDTMKSARDVAASGHPVVMALPKLTYFDAAESRLPGEPPAMTWIKTPISLATAYDWNPTPEGLDTSQARNILGPQGCFWTDQFLHNPQIGDMGVLNENRSARYVEYLVLPRMAALAEVAWTRQEERDFADFEKRMARQYARYTSAGWNYRLPVPGVDFEKRADGKFVATARLAVEGGGLRYTTNGETPLAHSAVYRGPVVVDRESDFRVVAVAPDGKHVSLPFAVKGNEGAK